MADSSLCSREHAGINNAEGTQQGDMAAFHRRASSSVVCLVYSVTLLPCFKALVLRDLSSLMRLTRGRTINK